MEPDVVVEYLFIEKAEKQVKPVNDDQAFIMGFFNIFLTGKFKNNSLSKFRALLLDELNYSLKTYDHFKTKELKLEEYKFALVDNFKNITEFEAFDEQFFDALINSLRNLLIVGKNFDISKFKHHEIFDRWFDRYTNRS